MENKPKQPGLHLWKILLFAFVYAAGVTALCNVFNNSIFLIHVENSIYDAIQSRFLIQSDNPGQSLRAPFEKELENVWLINLDEKMYAGSDGRINKKKLSRLLEEVAAIPSVKAVYLDYIYGSLSTQEAEDIILTRNMQRLGDRLVLPYSYSLERSGGYFDYLNCNEVKCQTELVFANAVAGYTHAEPLPGDPALRYLRLQMPSCSFYSCAYLLAERTHPQTARRIATTIENGQMEINYVADNPLPAENEVYHLSDADKFLRMPGPTRARISSRKPELILIGRFSKLSDGSCQPRDVLATPVRPDLYKTMVTLNAWLNIVTEKFLNRSTGKLQFGLNLLLGLIAGFWAQRYRDPTEKKFYTFLLEAALVGFLFMTVIMALYLNWDTKLSFAIPLLVFVRGEFFARLFANRFNPEKEGVKP